MKWTTDKPTVPGWYWWRGLAAKEVGADLTIVYVYQGVRWRWCQRDGSHGGVVLVDRMRGEWQGPIVPEEETT